MKGKISKDGILFVERGTELIIQVCPYSFGNLTNFYACNHECPLFGEPELTASGTKTMLNICKKMLLFEKFEDERLKQ